MHKANPNIGESIPVMRVVKSWADVVKRLGNPRTVLVMDSYYLDGAGRSYLRENNVQYVAAITKERFPAVFDLVKEKVTKPGEWNGVHNDETSETVIHYWDTDETIGKKLVISNAFERRFERGSKTIIPVYDLYKITFKSCDVFNKALHDRTWPHKHGGKNIPGDIGQQHNFIFSSILQNVYNCFLDVNLVDANNYDFKQMCLELSDALYSDNRVLSIN